MNMDEYNIVASMEPVVKPITKPVDTWITVNELPELEGMYLTYWTDGVIEVFSFENYEPNDQSWHGVHKPSMGGCITYWQELPQPPA